MTDTLTIRRPDDWHVHLRDGDMLAAVLPHTARDFGRAVVMPNLVPPVTTPEQARAYAARIREALPPGARFEPLMTAYLTDDIRPEDLERGHRSGAWVAAKLYPANATTNSAHGVRDLRNIRAALTRMADIGMPLLVHGEVTHDAVDVFDREAVFIREVLAPLRAELPELKIVFEHATTEEAVDFVGQHDNIGATITAHHLMINRSAIFAGGIRPHLYCLPIAKREKHRLALRRAATSGDARFFLGTDTAPHVRARKESACGCAGIFTAPIALACYAQVFDEDGALDQLEAFASLNGPAFYGLAPNTDTVTLKRALTPVPNEVEVAGASVHVFLGGQRLKWRVEV